MNGTNGTDAPLDLLDETTRQLVLGARLERDRVQEKARDLESSLRLMTKQYERVNNSLIRQNVRVMELERELRASQKRHDALQARCDVILSGPDGVRASQIMEHIRRLSDAASDLSDATVAYRTAFSHLTEMYSGLRGFEPDVNPDNHDHAFDYRWRYDEDEPKQAPAEPRRGGSLKQAIGATEQHDVQA